MYIKKSKNNEAVFMPCRDARHAPPRVLREVNYIQKVKMDA